MSTDPETNSLAGSDAALTTSGMPDIEASNNVEQDVAFPSADWSPTDPAPTKAQPDPRITDPLDNPELGAVETIDDNPQEWMALDSLGALDGEAVSRLAQFFQQAGAEEKSVYKSYLRAAQALTYSLPITAPPPKVREAILGIVGLGKGRGGHHYGEDHFGFSRRIAEKLGLSETRLLKILLCMAVSAAVALGILALRQHALAEIYAQSAVDAEKKRAEEQKAKTEIEHRLGLVTPRDLRVTEMNSTDPNNQQDAGRLYWGQFGRRGLLWIHITTPLAKGHEYALWVIANDEPSIVYRWSGSNEFQEIKILQSGRPKPIQAFYIVSQRKGSENPEAATKILVGNPYM